MLHIVMFSGGAASSVVAKMVADEHGDDTILLHTPTGAEHPDADRFRRQVAQFVGRPITVEKANKTLWEMVESYKHLPDNGFPYCTRDLKLIPKDRLLGRLDKVGEDYITYLGYGYDEWRRVQKVFSREETRGRKVKFPLFNARLTGDDCKNIIREEWKICLPEPYQYLSHNNCIPCYKGGKGHFYKVWQYYPEQFTRAARAEERAANTVFDGVTLFELAAKWEKEPEQIGIFEQESIPCMCAM
ncbi:MAG: phosphoadenosine phosphosulfate reductase family protein [Dehalococcoidia bacterium]